MIFEDGDLFLLTCAGEAITTWELLFIDFVRSTLHINFTLPNRLKCEKLTFTSYILNNKK